MTLTPAIKIAYANPIAAKSAIGFDSLNRLHSAPAPSNLLGAFLFLRLRVSLMAGYVGKPSGLPV